jgi:hypothetical protein
MSAIGNLNPELVILSQRSSSTLVEPNNSKTRLIYNQFLESNVLKLHSRIPRIMMIGSESEYLPADSVFQILLRQKGDWSTVPFEDRNFWAKKHWEGFVYFDSLKYLCPSNVCVNKIGAEWLFSDGHHLTPFGSMLLEPALAEKFKTYL